jgi:hypothetical protein
MLLFSQNIAHIWNLVYFDFHLAAIFDFGGHFENKTEFLMSSITIGFSTL